MVNCSTRDTYCERSTYEVTVFASIYVALSVVVITGNTMVIASYASNPKLRKGITVFFVSLAISDLCVGMIPIPYWIISLLVPHIRQPLNNHFSSFDIFSALASIFNLVAISIERRIVLSAKSKLIFPCGRLRKLNIIMICIAWFVALGISLCWWLLKQSTARGLLVFLSGFVIPLVVMLFIYFDIYRLVRINTKSQSSNSGALTIEQENTRVRPYEERKTAQTVLIITALFVIAWTPFFVCSMLSTFKMSVLPEGKKQQRLVDFVKWMHYSNSAVNPFIYAYRNEVMRKTMVRILRRVKDACLCTQVTKNLNQGQLLKPQRVFIPLQSIQQPMIIN